jgi:hypothetical protein
MADVAETMPVLTVSCAINTLPASVTDLDGSMKKIAPLFASSSLLKDQF